MIVMGPEMGETGKQLRQKDGSRGIEQLERVFARP